MRAKTLKKLEAMRNRIYAFHEELMDMAQDIETDAENCADTDKGEERREALEAEQEAVSELADECYNLVDQFDNWTM